MKRVQLTESQLKQVISEAVEKILTEMDWQIYVDTAKERLKQSKNKKRMFRNLKGWTDKDLEDRAKELRKHASEMRDKQYKINKYSPQDTDEAEYNLDVAALDHMAWLLGHRPSSKITREWDPYTKKFEINGKDILKRRRGADDIYRAASDDAFEWAKGDIVTDEDGTRRSNIWVPDPKDPEYAQLSDNEYERGDMYHPDEIKNNLEYYGI